MNDARLAELKEKYKNRNLMEELVWGIYADHSGYTNKVNAEFLNWLIYTAYKALKEVQVPSTGTWNKSCKCVMDGYLAQSWQCSECGHIVYNPNDNYCAHCGTKMR